MKANVVTYFCHYLQCDCGCCSSNFKHEIVELQTDDTLKGISTLVDFYEATLMLMIFSILRKYGRKYASLFGSTCRCEQFFSKLNLTKSPLHFSLTDENVEMELRVATSLT